MFALSTYNILHIDGYSTPTGEINLVRQFVKKSAPIKLATCKRCIYLFHNDQVKDDFLVLLLATLEQPQPQQAPYSYCKLDGEKAYGFLLFWALGGLRSDNLFHDSRLLGQLRSTIRAYEISNSKADQESYVIHKNFLDCLLNDTKKLHQALLEKRNLPLNELKLLFKTACEQCAKARAQGHLDFLYNFNYENFCYPDKVEEVLQDALFQRAEKLKNAFNTRTDPLKRGVFQEGIQRQLLKIKEHIAGFDLHSTDEKLEQVSISMGEEGASLFYKSIS